MMHQFNKQISPTLIIVSLFFALSTALASSIAARAYPVGVSSRSLARRRRRRRIQMTLSEEVNYSKLELMVKLNCFTPARGSASVKRSRDQRTRALCARNMCGGGDGRWDGNAQCHSVQHNESEHMLSLCEDEISFQCIV